MNNLKNDLGIENKYKDQSSSILFIKGFWLNLTVIYFGLLTLTILSDITHIPFQLSREILLSLPFLLLPMMIWEFSISSEAIEQEVRIHGRHPQNVRKYNKLILSHRFTFLGVVLIMLVNSICFIAVIEFPLFYYFIIPFLIASLKAYFCLRLYYWTNVAILS